MTAAIGTLGALGIGTSSTVDQRLDFVSENLARREQIIDGNGVRGTRSRSAERTRPGPNRVGGQIVFQPNAAEMQYLLPWILGTAVSTTTYALADTSLARYVTVDRITKVFTYDGVKVDTATFRFAQNELLRVETDVVGISESVGNTATFPAISLNTASGPWIMSDCTMTVGGTTVTPKEGTIRVNNYIDKERYFNSRNLVSVNALDREISFSTSLPYGDASAVYATGNAGVAVVVTFTNGVFILVMTMAAVVFGAESPTIPGRTEIMVPINGTAMKKSDGTLELVTTLAVS